MALLRANRELNEPIAKLDARYLEAGKDGRRAFESLDADDMAFIIREVARCIKGPEYYLENYHFIRRKDLIISTIFPLFDAQKLLLTEFERQFKLEQAIRIICLKARQMGITTISVALMCWLVFTHPSCHVISMSDEGNKVEMNFDMARTAHKLLPWWMKPEKRYDQRPILMGFDRVKADEREESEGLESKLFFESANQPSGAAYSKSLYGAHLAEIGRYRNAKPITEGIFGSLVGFRHSIGILEGTAQGRHTIFHKLWKKAEEGKFWTPVFMEWFREQGYTMAVPANFQRTYEEKAIAKKVKEECDYELSEGQFAWRREKIVEFEAAGEEESFPQEFPLCVCGETMVSTELGIIRVDRADRAKTTESGSIERWVIQPESDTYLLTTEKGRVLRATDRHPIKKTDGSFCALINLQEGDEIELRPPMFSENPYCHVWHPIAGSESRVLITEEWAEFVGYFMGDGSWYKNNLSIACDGNDPDVIERVAKITENILGSPPRKRIISKVQGRKGCVELRKSCARATEIFLELGIIHRNGEDRYRRQVCVPDLIFMSPRNIVKVFLAALFECDGSASGGCVRFGSKDLKFVQDVQLLLLGFGINSRISKNIKIAGNGNKYDFYALTLTVYSSRLFAEQIGFIGNRKRELLDGICSPKSCGRVSKDDKLVDYVKSVEISTREKTYDFTISGDHVFSANGILTHNTPEEAFVSSGLTAFPKKRLSEMALNFGRKPRWTGEIKLDHKDNRTPIITPYLEGRLWLWEFPKAGEKYQVGADCALGIDGADYSCAEVYAIPEDISQPLRQVGRWRGYMAPTEFARVMVAIGYLFNGAELAPECNKIDSVASDAAKVLMYPSVYRWIREDKIKNSQSLFVGWMTTPKNKNGLIGRMRDALLGWTVIVRCEEDIDEMYDFVESEPGSQIFGARYGSHDDTVMANLITFYTATQLRPRWALDVEEEKKEDGPILDYQNTDYSPIYDREGQDNDPMATGPGFMEL